MIEYISLTFTFTYLTHWDRVTHVCVHNLTINGLDNGLSPGRRQAIIWSNSGILLIGPLGINVSEIIIEIHAFSFKKIHLKMSSAKWRPFCLGLNVFRTGDALLRPWAQSALAQMMACTNILPGPIMTHKNLGNHRNVFSVLLDLLCM